MGALLHNLEIMLKHIAHNFTFIMSILTLGSLTFPALKRLVGGPLALVITIVVAYGSVQLWMSFGQSIYCMVTECESDAPENENKEALLRKEQQERWEAERKDAELKSLEPQESGLFVSFYSALFGANSKFFEKLTDNDRVKLYFVCIPNYGKGAWLAYYSEAVNTNSLGVFTTYEPTFDKTVVKTHYMPTIRKYMMSILTSNMNDLPDVGLYNKNLKEVFIKYGNTIVLRVQPDKNLLASIQSCWFF